jgi:hypothetical protein
MVSYSIVLTPDLVFKVHYFKIANNNNDTVQIHTLNFSFQRHDLIYWVTFGEDDSGNDLSSTEYLPWYGESWKSGPSVDAEYARKGHNGVKTILKSN